MTSTIVPERAKERAKLHNLFSSFQAFAFFLVCEGHVGKAVCVGRRKEVLKRIR